MAQFQAYVLNCLSLRQASPLGQFFFVASKELHAVQGYSSESWLMRYATVRRNNNYVAKTVMDKDVTGLPSRPTTAMIKTMATWKTLRKFIVFGSFYFSHPSFFKTGMKLVWATEEGLQKALLRLTTRKGI